MALATALFAPSHYRPLVQDELHASGGGKGLEAGSFGLSIRTLGLVMTILPTGSDIRTVEYGFEHKI